ncbi:5-formyltetrahydrofolate cyclo-ligase [Ignavibacteria bacterium]
MQSGNSDISEAKYELRRRTLAKRGHLDETTRQEFSNSIVKSLTLSPIFGQAATIHIYLSFGSEVNTEKLIAAAWTAGKRVATSIVLRDSPDLAHAIVLPDTRFVKGIFGVPTPINVQLLTAEQLGLTNFDIIIVPLTAFDKFCNRLGYGRGYYDRFLAKTAARRIGFGFALQEAADIPAEPTDVQLDFIFTEIDVIAR